MELTPATVVRVGHHLYDSAVLSYDDASNRIWCIFVSFNLSKKVKSSDKIQRAGREVCIVDTHWNPLRGREKRGRAKQLCILRHDVEKLLLVDLAILVKVKLVYHRLSDRLYRQTARTVKR